jgi:hypothetical protein
MALPAIARDPISATVVADYWPGEKDRLASIFIGSVKTWLQRYEHTLLVESPSYVKMQVRYDYVYTLELFVKDDEYEIKVTGSERARVVGNGQRDAARLASGIQKRMDARQRRRNEMKDRSSQ